MTSHSRDILLCVYMGAAIWISMNLPLDWTEYAIVNTALYVAIPYAAIRLPELVGVAKALELLWTGDFVYAPEAERIGMVNRVYPDDQLMDETYKFAKRLADGPASLLQMIKRATYQSSRVDLRTALDLISSHMGVVRTTDDSKDALAADAPVVCRSQIIGGRRSSPTVAGRRSNVRSPHDQRIGKLWSV